MVSEPGSNNKKLFAYIKDMKRDSSGVAPLKKDESTIRNPLIRSRSWMSSLLVPSQKKTALQYLPWETAQKILRHLSISR